MIRAVLVDFGGVFTLSPFEALRQMGSDTGLDVGVMLQVVFGPYDRDTDHPWHRVERGEVSLGEYREAVLEEFRGRGHDIDPFEILMRLGSGGDGGKPIREDVVEAVRAARGGGRRTAMITNNVLELRDLWRPLLPLEELFDAVVDSCEVGMRKPDPRIFELALELLGDVDPSEAVFLDDYEGNVVAAEKLGMRAILVGVDHRPAFAELARLLEGSA